MFLLKKIIAPFFMPVPMVLVLAIVGLFCLWFTRRQKAGKVLVTFAMGLLGVLSYGQVSDMLARPLEREYLPIPDYENFKSVRWVVVLSGGASVDPELPLSTYLSEACWRRLFEGAYIHKRNPGSKLILTGRSAFEGVTPIAEVMSEVAQEWGVKAENIIIEGKAKDTRDHAALVKEIVGEDRFVLVTSASHMARAMALFRGQGMEPIAAPTDYMVKNREGRLTPQEVFPSAEALEKAERAVHEYLGIVWARVRGQI